MNSSNSYSYIHINSLPELLMGNDPEPCWFYWRVVWHQTERV